MAHTHTKSAGHSDSRCCITRPNLVTKCSVIQKISSRKSFSDILNLRCDLDLKRSNPVFHRTLQLMMLYYQTKFGCKSTSSVEDTTEIVIFWLYKSSHNHTRFGILNFRCDLDIEHSNPIFPQDTPAYDAVIIYHVCWQTDQQFRTTPVASTQRSKWMDRSLRQSQASNSWAQL